MHWALYLKLAWATCFFCLCLDHSWESIPLKDWPRLMLHLWQQVDAQKWAGQAFHNREINTVTCLRLCIMRLLLQEQLQWTSERLTALKGTWSLFCPRWPLYCNTSKHLWHTEDSPYRHVAIFFLYLNCAVLEFTREDQDSEFCKASCSACWLPVAKLGWG